MSYKISYANLLLEITCFNKYIGIPMGSDLEFIYFFMYSYVPINLILIKYFYYCLFVLFTVTSLTLCYDLFITTVLK